MEKNREFAKLAGVPVADFDLDPLLVLREMMKRKDWYQFLISIDCPVKFAEVCIPISYILDTSGKLRDAATKFMRRKNDGKK